MKRPALVRRRQVWLPTLFGWLVLLVVAGVALALAGRRAASFLAPNEPVAARLLVVEGWLPSAELDQTLAVFRAGGYERVITTGGPIEDGFEPDDSRRSYAERARGYLVRAGLPADAVIAVPAPESAQDRSFLSAVMVREWATRSGQGIDALDVLSSGVHARRSRALYRLAFGPSVRIGILAARPGHWDPDAWWRTSAGAKDVLTEAIAWLWTTAFFDPGPPGSHEELWGG